jgi:putative acyl-CoA dehydrogenase
MDADFNQAPPLVDLDLFSTNRPLVEATERAGAGWVLERAARLGRLVGGEPLRWGFQANANPPRLETHDRYGNRIDEVEFHPAWHELMRLGVAHELHALPWRTDAPAAHSARAALYMTAIQAEAGFGCPITMTYAAVPALRAQADLAAVWEPLLTSTSYDPRLATASRASCSRGSSPTGRATASTSSG